MALRISRRLWTRGRPLCSGVGRCPSRYAHSASERSVRYGFLMCLMHARVATQIPDYPFSDSFMTEFSEVRTLRDLSLTAFAWGARPLWWRRLGFVANRDSEQRENHHRGSS